MVSLFLRSLVQGGVYLFELIDYCGCNGTCILFGFLIQCLAVGWAFGKQSRSLKLFYIYADCLIYSYKKQASFSGLNALTCFKQVKIIIIIL